MKPVASDEEGGHKGRANPGRRSGSQVGEKGSSGGNGQEGEGEKEDAEDDLAAVVAGRHHGQGRQSQQGRPWSSSCGPVHRGTAGNARSR